MQGNNSMNSLAQLFMPYSGGIVVAAVEIDQATGIGPLHHLAHALS